VRITSAAAKTIGGGAAHSIEIITQQFTKQCFAFKMELMDIGTVLIGGVWCRQHVRPGECRLDAITEPHVLCYHASIFCSPMTHQYERTSIIVSVDSFYGSIEAVNELAGCGEVHCRSAV
jgi:hypothetical protein